MTVAHVYTVAFAGIDAREVDVQVQIGAGLPAFTIVGLPDKAVDAAGEGIANAYGVAAQMTKNGMNKEAARVVEAAKQSFVSAWTQSMWVGVVLAALAVAVLAVFGPRRAK